jgi:4-hydroxy-tetrahydrodipicolinate synthase
MAVYSGDDETAWELMLLGANGNISVTANIAPKAMSEVCAVAIAKMSNKQRRLTIRLQIYTIFYFANQTQFL